MPAECLCLDTGASQDKRSTPPAHPDYSLRGREVEASFSQLFKVQASVSIHTVFLRLWLDAPSQNKAIQARTGPPQGEWQRCSGWAVPCRGSPWASFNSCQLERTFSTQNCCQISHSGLAQFHRHPSRGLHCQVPLLAAVPAPCLRSTLVPAGSSPPSCGELLAIPFSHPCTSTGSTSPQSVPATGTLRFLLYEPTSPGFWVVHSGILVPPPAIEPVPPAAEVQSPNHWTAREVPPVLVFSPVFLFQEPCLDWAAPHLPHPILFDQGSLCCAVLSCSVVSNSLRPHGL